MSHQPPVNPVNEDAARQEPAGAEFLSPYLAVGFAQTCLDFACLEVDSLGRGGWRGNPVLSVPVDPPFVRVERRGSTWAYYPRYATASAEPVWTIMCDAKSIIMRSRYQPLPPTPPGLEPETAFTLCFRQKACAATLLGRMPPESDRVELPCVLHLPDRGSLRISSPVPGLGLEYHATRQVRRPLVRYVQIRFPAATAGQGEVEYRMETALIHPELPGLEKDPRFDAFRRNFLNMFQLVSRHRMLGTHASSDCCPFTLYMFAEAATPKVLLAEGLFTSDLVRMTADRYLDGFKGYGQPGGEHHVGEYTFSDVNPSLILGCALYAKAANDLAWARRRHAAVMDLCRQMLSTDRTGSGLIQYGTSGNHGDRPTSRQRPANWWDCINFGHEDGYANAIAFRALGEWAQVSGAIGFADDARTLSQARDRLGAAFRGKLFNPASGLFAGWRSADGELHDYGFVFLNSLAVAYGVVEGEEAHCILDRVMARLRGAGYNRWRMGLPGNLVPIRRGDYVVHLEHPDEDPRIFGVPRLEDGSDGFPYYENGGASMRFAVFTLKALYRLGRVEEARAMLMPMMDGFTDGDYQGFDEQGNSRDWRTWQGQACGYEGFAVGNYLPLLAVLDEWASRKGRPEAGGA